MRGDPVWSHARSEELTMPTNQTSEVLESLGLTPVEAVVYLTLLASSPATGYRIAAKSGKSAANVYKVLETLEKKGAVLSTEGPRRLYSAVKPAEFIARLDRDYQNRREVAVELLDSVVQPEREVGIFRLRNEIQVIERARSMLEGARGIVLIDVFPRFIEPLRSSMEAAVARGVTTAMLTYEETELDGARVTHHHRADQVRGRWNGSWLNLVVDGSEGLMSYFDEAGDVRDAAWISSPFMAYIYHCGLASEIFISAVVRARTDDSPQDTALLEALAEFSPVFAFDARGYSPPQDQVP